MFTIEVRGRRYRFATLALAQKAASDIFTKTGIVVGINRAA